MLGRKKKKIYKTWNIFIKRLQSFITTTVGRAYSLKYIGSYFITSENDFTLRGAFIISTGLAIPMGSSWIYSFFLVVLCWITLFHLS